jgi:glycine betaine/proline transport system substrate-binding protein
MIDAWFPDTHASYWKKVHQDVNDLGPMYNGAVVGWVVPDYVSKAMIGSISDLKKHGRANKLDHTIVGIDPDAGEMKQSAKAMKNYGLKGSYHLKAGSDQAMTKALAHAIQNLDPIVVTLWTPHWAFAKWHLRFLADPKHVFGGPQHIDTVVRKGFRKAYPKVAIFLTNLYIPLHELQKAMYVAHQTGEKTAVAKFVKNHRGLVESWWIGTGVKVSGAGADADIADGS